VDVVVGVGEGGWGWAGVEPVEVHLCPFHYAEDAVGESFRQSVLSQGHAQFDGTECQLTCRYRRRRECETWLVPTRASSWPH
jgi:hypothetical protein